MEITKRTYNILLTIFIIGIVSLFGLLYLYNESRIDMVEKAEAEGYTCEKNIFGFYKKCYSDNYLNESGYTPITNWNEYIENQSKVNTSGN